MTTATARLRHRPRSTGARAWYPIALVLTALPCAWLGGAVYRAR